MTGSQASDSTVGKEHDALHPTPKSNLRLECLPPVFVLALHLSTEELHRAEDELSCHGAPLTYDITEARIVLGNTAKKRRAKLELQWANVMIDESDTSKSESLLKATGKGDRNVPATKRRKLNKNLESRMVAAETKSSPGSSTAESETENEDNTGLKPLSQLSISQVEKASVAGISDSEASEKSSSSPFDRDSFAGRVKVVKLDWFYESLAKGKPQPFEPFIVYEAKLLPPHEPAIRAQTVSSTIATRLPRPTAGRSPHVEESAVHEIVKRAQADAKPHFSRNQRRERVTDAMKNDFTGRRFLHAGGSKNQSFTKPSKLLHQTTSEHDEDISQALPQMPDWVLQNKIYSCERSTPLHCPNEKFIEQLSSIKLARVLTGDDIGVRAYSTSIASIAAYPHVIASMREVLALPGCDQKIAYLFHEWQDSGGTIQAVADIESNQVLTVLRQFYEIWGVGAKTAREFYYDHGWRDLDDIVEKGWKSLQRVQQIGLKYYDEFQLKMSRSEVEAIAAIVAEHGCRVTDSGLECIIVGGYRRGKDKCGDVDIILSHREEHQTYDLVDRVTKSLETEGWITHTLTVNLTNTKRDQQPLPLAPLAGGHGFDTLDKALVVWQSQDWPTRSADLAVNPRAKNQNPHRRVDIIVSPWRTVGCAIAGWTSGTTFQRDLRRYVKNVKGWKFDSSGVRERGSGRWVDLEEWGDPKTRAPTWQVAERRVFEGLGLVYREPWERCTG